MTSPDPVQPVAWMYERNDGYYRFVEKVRWGDDRLDGGTSSLSYTETPLFAHPPTPSDLAERVEGLVETLQRIEVMSSDERARIWATAALETQRSELPADVIALVIAAREAWEAHGSSRDQLDKALEAFSSRVPYDDEPAAILAALKEVK